MNFNNNNNNNNTVIIIMSSKLQILLYGAGADPIWSEPDSAPGPKDRKIEAGDKNKYFWHRNTSINT